MIQAIQLLLALSFLVVIHELGHFTFARIFGVRVEKFYMFFNWRFSLMRAKKFDGRWHFRFFAPNTTEEDEWSKHPESTEWGIGWIPFGGYCAICGMVDETHSSDDIAKTPPQPWEFRAKNVWQRLCIIIGGILVNFIAALLIFGQLLYIWGTDTLPLRNVDRGLYYSQLLTEEGFVQQDRILTINGEEPEDLSDVMSWLVVEGRRDVVVLRGQDTVALTLSEDLGKRYLALQNEYDRVERQKLHSDKSYVKSRYIFISEYIPFVIDSVFPGTAAEMAGLQRGDSIVAVCGKATPCAVMVTEELRKHPCETITLSVWRDTTLFTAECFLGDQCRIGVIPRSKYDYFETEHRDYGFWESIPAGIAYGWDILVNYVKQMKLVFTKEGAQSVGGFGAIGSMFPKMWNWYLFWYMTAFLSLILAFMNFLPIPALDGGYILFLLVEIFTGKQPSDKFLERANNIGFWLLLALLVLANGNDVFRFFF